MTTLIVGASDATERQLVEQLILLEQHLNVIAKSQGIQICKAYKK